MVVHDSEAVLHLAVVDRSHVVTRSVVLSCYAVPAYKLLYCHKHDCTASAQTRLYRLPLPCPHRMPWQRLLSLQVLRSLMADHQLLYVLFTTYDMSIHHDMNAVHDTLTVAVEAIKVGGWGADSRGAVCVLTEAVAQPIGVGASALESKGRTLLCDTNIAHHLLLTQPPPPPSTHTPTHTPTVHHTQGYMKGAAGGAGGVYYPAGGAGGFQGTSSPNSVDDDAVGSLSAIYSNRAVGKELAVDVDAHGPGQASIQEVCVCRCVCIGWPACGSCHY